MLEAVVPQLLLRDPDAEQRSSGWGLLGPGDQQDKLLLAKRDAQIDRQL
jgi:hypothetical protein